MVPIAGVSRFFIKAGSWVGWWFKFGFLSLFFIYLLVSSVMFAIHERDAGLAIQEIGKQLFSPLETAQEEALSIIESEKSSLTSSLWSYLGFYFQLYKIYLWIIIFLKFVNIFMKDSNAPIIRIFLALLLFYFFTTTYSVAFLDKSINYPFEVSMDIFRAISHIITNQNVSSSIKDMTDQTINQGTNITKEIVDFCPISICA